MKAYKIYSKGADAPAIIVWDTTRSKAKEQALENEWFDGSMYIDMVATRQAWADDMGDLSEFELLKEMLKHGWGYYLSWDDPMAYVDEEDLPNIEKYNSIEELYSAYESGAFITKCEEEYYEK